jgi:hypothetical protein
MAYQRALGVAPPPNEKRPVGRLPQHFADQFGWEDLAKKTANIYQLIPLELRQKTAILTDNYGQAGALNWYWISEGFPSVVSGHNAYFTWGPPQPGRAAVLIAITRKPERLRQVYGEVVQVAATDNHPFAMPDANGVPIFLCQRPKHELSVVWSSFRRYL